MGVSDMAFHKNAGPGIEDMARSNWVYRKLRNFRAGMPEARLRLGTVHLAWA
jgi:IS5 family transposase